MKLSPTRRTLFLALPLGIMIGAAGALAANPELDTANTHVDKAIAALKAAYNPKHKNEFGGHGKRAIELLDEVKKEIAKAKAFDDRHPKEDQPDAGPGPKQPQPGPTPTSSGPGPKQPQPGPKQPQPGPKQPQPGPKQPQPGPKG